MRLFLLALLVAKSTMVSGQNLDSWLKNRSNQTLYIEIDNWVGARGEWETRTFKLSSGQAEQYWPGALALQGYKIRVYDDSWGLLYKGAFDVKHKHINMDFHSSTAYYGRRYKYSKNWSGLSSLSTAFQLW